MADAAVQRVNMVDSQVRPSDVTDRRIIRAMLEVPREAFVPPGRRALAYADIDVPLGPPHRALLAPRVFAKLIQLAALGDADTVLIVGCGSGYAAAVLSHIAARVVALEADDSLRALAQAALTGPQYGQVQVVQGTLGEGYAAGAPYDAVFLEGAISEAPQELLGQLKDGGRLVAILAEPGASRATVWRRSGRTFGETAGFDASAEVLPDFVRKPTFAL